MVNAKRANALIWTGNVLLIIGIVAFAFQFLIFPEVRTLQDEKPVSVPEYRQPIDPTDTNALAKLPNPLLPTSLAEGPKARPGSVRLIGTDRIQDDPTADVAYLVLVGRNLNVNAYVDEPIRDESAGQEIAELSGWRLKKVTPKSAEFSTPSGPQTLELEEFTPSGPTGGVPQPGGALAGQPWEGGKYTTKKNPRSNDSQEIWDIDRKEMDWAAANADAIMREVGLEPYPGGGLKINSIQENGFAYERGFRSGDVIRSVNGQPIESVAKLSEVTRGLSRSQTTLTVQVDRSGRLYTLQYTVPRGSR